MAKRAVTSRHYLAEGVAKSVKRVT